MAQEPCRTGSSVSGAFRCSGGAKGVLARVLSRLMPAMQVFFLGVPATIMLGFVLMAGVLGLMMAAYLREISAFLLPFAPR